jgi:hypothetical protein
MPSVSFTPNLRRRMDQERCREKLGMHRRRLARRIHAPNQVADPAIQDVHRLQACPVAPEVLWAQHHRIIVHFGKRWR